MVFADLLRCRRHFAATHDRIDAREELLHAERFRDVVVGAAAEAAHLVRLLSARRQKDHRHLRDFADVIEHLEAAALRQHQIEKHQIGTLRVKETDRLFAVAGGDGLEVFVAQIDLETLAQSRFILDDENFRHAISYEVLPTSTVYPTSGFRSGLVFRTPPVRGRVRRPDADHLRRCGGKADGTSIRDSAPTRLRPPHRATQRSAARA